MNTTTQKPAPSAERHALDRVSFLGAFFIPSRKSPDNLAASKQNRFSRPFLRSHGDRKENGRRSQPDSVPSAAVKILAGMLGTFGRVFTSDNQYRGSEDNHANSQLAVRTDTPKKLAVQTQKG